jgi:glucose-6-phosphate 1-dehydrogenase
MTEVVENPLLEGLRLQRVPEPCSVTIFGASGDLARRKLLPALYSLALHGLLPERFAVLGVGRTELTDAEFTERMRRAVQEHGRDELEEDVWERLAAGMRYVTADIGREEGSRRILEALTELERARGADQGRLFYLSVPPSAIEPTVLALAGWPMAGWRRLVVEKPFGHDLESAMRLNALVLERFEEGEVCRIDHYLGKETVQNLLVLRFANGIFEPLWNRQFVDHVQITVAESIGIEGRADFYEQAGALRDIFQNHLLQLVALTAMEPPIDFSAESVRNEKLKVLRAIRRPNPADVVRGQYGPGYVEGEPVPGYRDEPGVSSGSRTETLAAAKLLVDNWRWADTPFYVRVGKRMPKRETTIAIQFKRAPHPPFELDALDELRPNVLLLHLQPDEGVSLTFNAKVPGQGVTIRTVRMDFLYGGAFRTGLPEAYERLIHDCLLGDAILFTRADEVEAQWSLVDEIRHHEELEPDGLPGYAAGTWGPPAADELLHRDGRSWRRH